ncbi:MAG: GGDEF domain-containing protein [Actinomycetota bacterium]|nr:GGDEF domain-containing protein [Actinomycetota bacterium]
MATVTPEPPSPAPYRSWLPRLTSKVMVDLRIWMTVFGLIIGLVFPFLVMPLGVASGVALRPLFFVATIGAGLVVSQVAYLLAHAVIGVRLRALAQGMQQVETTLVDATFNGDWAACDPESCKVPVDSTDSLGAVAASFNRLVEGLATSHRISDGISALGDALAAHLDLAQLADSTLDELALRTGCDAAALLTVSNGRVELAGSFGIKGAEALAEGESVREVLRAERAIILNLPPDVVVTSAVVDITPQEVRVVPVRNGVVIVGVLVVAFARPCSGEAAAVLDATLPGLGVALSNALNHMDLQRVAALDPLTGVFNRRFGLQRLREEVGRSQRTGDPLGLLMFDLDHFKAINDTYGHLVGDRVLQAVVRSTRSVLREGDVLVRYGGEEFVIVLPGAGRDDRQAMAERVRRAVADSEISENGQHIAITVSVGGAGMPDQSVRVPEDLIGVADQAMYAAKNAGRDRCVMA